MRNSTLETRNSGQSAPSAFLGAGSEPRDDRMKRTGGGIFGLAAEAHFVYYRTESGETQPRVAVPPRAKANYLEAAMNEHTRREFLWRALPGAAVAGAGLTMLRPWVSLAADAQLTPGKAERSYTAGKYALEIDGQFAGWLESAEGGHATSDVVGEKAERESIQRKHIAGVKYEDITVTCGAGMSRNFYEWIRASLDKQYSRKNGALITCDYNYKELSRTEWSNALITEVGF